MKNITFSREEIANLKELPVFYGDDKNRIKKRAITVNRFVVSNIASILVKDGLLLFLDSKGKETIRLRVDYINSVLIHSAFGEYRFN